MLHTHTQTQTRREGRMKASLSVVVKFHGTNSYCLVVAEVAFRC